MFATWLPRDSGSDPIDLECAAGAGARRLAEPLLEASGGAGCGGKGAVRGAAAEAADSERSRRRAQQLLEWAQETCECVCQLVVATTEPAFIRSEVNGRRSRRIVLLAFFCTDAIGALLWASWCQVYGGHAPDATRACRSFGLNHFAVLAASLPVEGTILFEAGRNPWSIWSDGLLVPLWLVRLIFFDVLLWNVSPPALVSDALWFSVMAVMCRVHSLALVILVGCQVCSMLLIFGMQGVFSLNNFDQVRYGMYSVAMLVIMAGAYFLDEQSRLQSFGQLMSLQDMNAVMADQLIRWKFIPGGAFAPDLKDAGSVPDDLTSPRNSQSSTRSCLKGPRAPGDPLKGRASTVAANITSLRRDQNVRFSIPRQTTPGGTDLGSLVPTSRPSRVMGSPTPVGVQPVDLCDVME